MKSTDFHRSFSNKSDTSSVYPEDNESVAQSTIRAVQPAPMPPPTGPPGSEMGPPTGPPTGPLGYIGPRGPLGSDAPMCASTGPPIGSMDTFESSIPNLNPNSSYEVQRNKQTVQPLNLPSPQNSYAASPDHSETGSIYSQTQSVRESQGRQSPPLLNELPSPANSHINQDSDPESYLRNGVSQLSVNQPSSTNSYDEVYPRYPSSRSVPNLNARMSTNTLTSNKKRRDSSRMSMRNSSVFDFNIFDTMNESPGGSALLPRLKTIDLYRKTAKKANDPELEFQLAQFIIQTAIIARPSALERHNRIQDMKSSEQAQKREKKEQKRQHKEQGNQQEDQQVQKDTTEDEHMEPPSTSPPPPSKSKKDSNEEDLIDLKTVQGMMREGMSSLKRLAERGHVVSQYLLGDLYFSEAVGKPDLEKGAKYFIMAAKHQHPEAAYRAALCLQEGWGCARDAARAVQFYKTAAFKNQPGALYQLGMVYFHGGLGISDNSNNRLTGVKWLSRAAKAANKTYNRAPHELAKIYEVGYKDVVFPDAGYAARLYAHSADLGYVPSAARLGRAYEFGELSCPQDPALSIHYYTIAALGNDPRSQLSMCAWYMVGAGPSFPINQDEAYEWALRAALNGLPKAQYTLGFFYEQGIGTHQNIIEAGKWYKRSAANGYEKANAKLKSLGVKDDKTGKGKCVIM